jgi:hypothetical protein
LLVRQNSSIRSQPPGMATDRRRGLGGARALPEESEKITRNDGGWQKNTFATVSQKNAKHALTASASSSAATSRSRLANISVAPTSLDRRWLAAPRSSPASSSSSSKDQLPAGTERRTADCPPRRREATLCPRLCPGDAILRLRPCPGRVPSMFMFTLVSPAESPLTGPFSHWRMQMQRPRGLWFYRLQYRLVQP